ncbi:unnamed protein product, partial [Phaeothamnion confervicola]
GGKRSSSGGSGKCGSGRGSNVGGGEDDGDGAERKACPVGSFTRLSDEDKPPFPLSKNGGGGKVCGSAGSVNSVETTAHPWGDNDESAEPAAAAGVQAGKVLADAAEAEEDDPAA